MGLHISASEVLKVSHPRMWTYDQYLLFRSFGKRQAVTISSKSLRKLLEQHSENTEYWNGFIRSVFYFDPNIICLHWVKKLLNISSSGFLFIYLFIFEPCKSASAWRAHGGSAEIIPAPLTVGRVAGAAWFTVWWQGVFTWKPCHGVANEKDKKFTAPCDW